MQWVSLTSNGVELLLKNRNLLLKEFKYTWCPDEMFIQTLFWNLTDHQTICTEPIRLIDWKRGRPYTFQSSDFKELIDSDMLFARKFSTQTKAHKSIVDLIYNHLTKKISYEKKGIIGYCSCI